ncbi:MAG: 4'-phosphopantetheinyl transferase superfamily protein [Bacteroidota bacterium]
MPLLLTKRIDPSSAYAIWKISEPLDELGKQYPKRPEGHYHPHKLAEWLATRILIQHLCMKFGIDFQGIRKDEFGKPFLINSTAQISISHAFPIASAMIDLHAPCGIDVEWPRRQLVTVQKKFLHRTEYSYVNNEVALCIIWAAKEAIYKRYGKKRLSFKEHIIIQLLEDHLIADMITEVGAVRVPLVIEQVKQYYLVYSRH